MSAPPYGRRNIMWSRVIWPAAIVAFLCDVGTDLLVGNGTVNVITFIVVFAIVGMIRFSMLASKPSVSVDPVSTTSASARRQHASQKEW
jgi:hypothetical protein